MDADVLYSLDPRHTYMSLLEDPQQPKKPMTFQEFRDGLKRRKAGYRDYEYKEKGRQRIASYKKRDPRKRRDITDGPLGEMKLDNASQE